MMVNQSHCHHVVMKIKTKAANRCLNPNQGVYIQRNNLSLQQRNQMSNSNHLNRHLYPVKLKPLNKITTKILIKKQTLILSKLRRIRIKIKTKLNMFLIQSMNKEMMMIEKLLRMKAKRITFRIYNN